MPRSRASLKYSSSTLAGIRVPKGGREAVPFRLHPELVEGLTVEAARHGVTRSRLVETVLAAFLADSGHDAFESVERL